MLRNCQVSSATGHVVYSTADSGPPAVCSAGRCCRGCCSAPGAQPLLLPAAASSAAGAVAAGLCPCPAGTTCTSRHNRQTWADSTGMITLHEWCCEVLQTMLAGKWCSAEVTCISMHVMKMHVSFRCEGSCHFVYTALVLCVTLTIIRSRSLTSLLLVGRFSARSMLV
jgi:hypothetical protein